MQITEPVPPGLARTLRAAVLEHAGAEKRRVYPTTVWVGVPGQHRRAHLLEPGGHDDHALRVDVVEAMLRRARVPGTRAMVWLTRPGPLDTQDVDLQWLGAVRAAGDELGTSLAMVVVDRRSWRDPGTGAGRTWARLRQR